MELETALNIGTWVFLVLFFGGMLKGMSIAIKAVSQ